MPPAPSPRRRLLWWALGLFVLGALAYAGLSWQRKNAARHIAMAGVPPQPALEGWPAEFRARLTAQEDAIFAGNKAAEALGTLAALYHANGFYAEAQQAYTTLRELQPREPRWAHFAADIHAVFGELDEAVPLWQTTVRLAPDYVPARVRLGEAELKRGRLDQASTSFSAALEREPDNPYAQLGLARVDIARDAWPAARAKLEKIARQTEGLLGADLLATAFEQTGEPQRGTALRARQKSHGLYVGIADPWVIALMDECFDPYRLALESGTANIRGDGTRARQLLERALRLDPKDANLHFQAGTLAEQRGDLPTARNELQAAVRSDPKLTDAWAAWVRVLAAAGDPAGSWRVLSEGLTLNPESPVLLLERGRRFKAQGRTEAAMADLRRVTQLRRDEALAFVELASLYFAQERTDEGIQILEQGLVAEPGHPAALAILTFACIHSGQRAAAERWLREVQDQPRVSAAEVQKLRQAYQEKFGQPPPSAAPSLSIR